MTSSGAVEQVRAEGFAVVRCAAGDETIAGLKSAFLDRANDAIQRGGAVYARRRALDLPAVREWALSGGLALAQDILGNGAQPVRGILFDKRPEANWPVAWHQDVTIAVSERRDVAGYGPWSVKGSVPHVRPPSSVLDRMVTVRLHLDDCPASNGALRVIPQSHRNGTLGSHLIRGASAAVPPVVCEANAGDALLMRPLLLHSSAPSEAPRHRRVVHVEYASGSLDGGLEWAEAPRG